MIYRRRLALMRLIVWMPFLVAPSLAQVARVPREGKVVIRVVDENGKVIDCELVSFRPFGMQADFSSRFTGLRGVGIPFGDYKYSVRRTDLGGFHLGPWDVSGTIKVNVPEILAIADTPRNPPLGDRSPRPDYALQGKLDPMPSNSDGESSLRIRFASLDRTDFLDVPVQPSGEFTVYKQLHGRYVLVVIHEDQVLHTQQLVFGEKSSTEPFVVKLSAQAPGAIHIP